MFDSVFVPSRDENVKTLLGIGLARFNVRGAFGHLKALGAVGDGIKLVEAAIREAEDFKLACKDQALVNQYGVVTVAKQNDVGSVNAAFDIVREAKDFVGQCFYEIGMHKNWARELDGIADQVTV